MYHQIASNIPILTFLTALDNLYRTRQIPGLGLEPTPVFRLSRNMNGSYFDPAEVKLGLLAILMVLLGTAIAILGSKVGGPPVVVGGVAIIVLGARLLRPISHGILKWLDDKNA